MHVLRSTFFALALLMPSLAPLQAQQTAPLPDSVRELLTELQTLQARLESTQTVALEENPALQERRREIEGWVTDVMLDANPGMEAKFERLPELQQELVEARQAQDTAQLREIVREGRRIQSDLSRIRAEVMQRDEVQERVSDFRRDLLVAMREVDPEIQDVVARVETLARKLQGLQPGG